MKPKYLINKHTKLIWEYTDELATNRNLEPYFGEETLEPNVQDIADNDTERTKGKGKKV